MGVQGAPRPTFGKRPEGDPQPIIDKANRWLKGFDQVSLAGVQSLDYDKTDLTVRFENELYRFEVTRVPGLPERTSLTNVSTGEVELVKAQGIAPIDLVVVNLYPFEATIAAGAGYDECVENIDIGGPAMIRAAAKNHADVAVVVDAQDYAALLAEIEQYDGATTLALRRRLDGAAQRALHFAARARQDQAAGERRSAAVLHRERTLLGERVPH